MPSSGGQKSALDRKSTRLNSSHTIISYAVFCLKKKQPPAHRPPSAAPVATAPEASPRARRPEPAAPPVTDAQESEASGPPDVCGLCFFLIDGRPPKSTLFPPPSPSG